MGCDLSGSELQFGLIWVSVAVAEFWCFFGVVGFIVLKVVVVGFWCFNLDLVFQWWWLIGLVVSWFWCFIFFDSVGFGVLSGGGSWWL